VSEGKIKYRETVVEGLENAPRAFVGSSRARTSESWFVKVQALTHRWLCELEMSLPTQDGRASRIILQKPANFYGPTP